MGRLLPVNHVIAKEKRERKESLPRCKIYLKCNEETINIALTCKM